MKEKVRDGTVTFEYIKSDEQIADVLTKAINGYKFTKLSEQTMGLDENDYRDTRRE